MVAFIQQIAAEDQIVATEQRVGSQPRRGTERQRRQLIERNIVLQKGFGQRMIITGGDISAASREYQAGERDAAAEFKNGFSGNREMAHLFR